MNYGDLIGDAFRITLRNRYLWFFGFFVGGTGVELLRQRPYGWRQLQPRRLPAVGLGLSARPRSGRGYSATRY